MAKLKIGRLFGRNLYIGSDQDFNDMEEGSYMIVTEKNSVSSLVVKSHGEAVDVIVSGSEQNNQNTGGQRQDPPDDSFVK